MSLSRYALIVLLLFAKTISFAQNTSERGWDNTNPLQWSDFQAPIDPTSSFDANTYSGINYKWRMHIGQGKISFDFITSSFMDKSKSWTRPEKQTPALLKHEQVHFDISEFFARKLLVAFNGYSYTDDYRNEITRIFQQVNSARATMEDKYDEQTDHSRNKAEQAVWELYVSNLLNNNYTYEQAIEKEPVGR
jgi:hypothetical protein